MTASPYYPIGVEIPHYVPNTMSTMEILLSFGGSLALVLVPGFIVARRFQLSGYETWTMLWFILSGCIHLILEGFYARNFSTLAGQSHPLAQAWKEYALSDSRYLTTDPFMIVMESVTAFLWGPICLLLAVFIVTDNPLRLPLTIIVCVGQIYGDVLYYGICFLMELLYEVRYSRPEAYYFYGYYVLLNAFWMVAPGYILWRSVVEVRDAVGMVQQAMKRQIIAQRTAAKG
ncbi:hypothetical protein TD95_003806, partial [Thielaviopsis punctulata]